MFAFLRRPPGNNSFRLLGRLYHISTKNKLIGYDREQLLKINKLSTVSLKENLVKDIYNNPLDKYKQFYDNQYNINDNNEIIVKIIGDINTRLNDTSILNLPQFTKFKDSLNVIKTNGIDILNKNSKNNILPTRLYSFVTNYVETMYDIVKSCDDKINGTYHTLFAKDFMRNLCKPGNNTRIFFTFENLDIDYLINIRPTCFYPVALMNVPNFSQNQYQNNIGPLIPTKYVTKVVEGKTLNFKETTFHDLGHSYVMNRQDSWLFDNLNKNPVELVQEFIRNKDWYLEELNKLHDTNYPLYKAAKLYLFDIVHDRGYQFYLPILRQQFRAIKNWENIKTKIIRGDFNDSMDYVDEHVLSNIDEARKFLLKITDEFIFKDNIMKKNTILNGNNSGYIIKKYLDVESFRGKPVSVIIEKKGKIIVNFEVNGEIKSTSLYEIELLNIDPTNEILTDNKIGSLNEYIKFVNNNHVENLKLDGEANICNQLEDFKNFITKDDKTTEDLGKYDLKSIEIFKLERVLQLIKNNATTNFSVTKLPEVHTINFDTDNILRDYDTFDPNSLFKLNEISIENKPKETLKYINLDANARFVRESTLRKSYIKYEHTKNPDANPYVTLNDELELGIVNTKDNLEIAKAVSCLLTRSIDTAKDIYGGYLPANVVTRAQLEYVSPWSVSNLWGAAGNRFVLSRKVDHGVREIIGTALTTSSKEILLFFTSKYNNVKYSGRKHDINFNLLTDDGHKWFDQFDMPPIEHYRPEGYNQLANFAIHPSYRGQNLGKLLITQIIKNYALHYPKSTITHSQPLICSPRGIYQIADVSWRPFMLNIGFRQRYGAEQFFIERDWCPLEPVIHNGKKIDNIEFNHKYGMPQIYEDVNIDELKEENIKNPDLHLIDRIPNVINLAQSGIAKLQYFQLVCTFDEYKEN